MLHVLANDVARLVRNRPERRNAVDLETLEALISAVDSAVDASARALVLSGAGGYFCAGADLRSVENEVFTNRLRHLLDLLPEAPLCTIAAIEGPCLGLGVQLAAACDLRVSTADARIGVPAAKLGLMVDHKTVVRVARLSGPGTAAAMLLAADEMTGQRAYDLGIVQRIGSVEDAIAWAEHIATLAPLTIQGHKLSLGRADHDSDDDVVAAFRRAWASEDLKEGRAAFAERRTPQFRGR